MYIYIGDGLVERAARLGAVVAKKSGSVLLRYRYLFIGSVVSCEGGIALES